MAKFGIIVLCLATRCFLPVTARTNLDTLIELFEIKIREVLLETSSSLRGLFSNFLSNRNLPDGDIQIGCLVATRVAKIISANSNVKDVVRFLSDPSLLRHAGLKLMEHFRESETNVTKLEIRSLLEMMPHLKTALLAMNGIHVEATNETASYFLEEENVFDLFSRFISPAHGYTTNLALTSTVDKFIQFALPYWLNTSVDLVRVDTCLGTNEFEFAIDTTKEAMLFVPLDEDEEQWSALIVIFVIVPEGSLSAFLVVLVIVLQGEWPVFIIPFVIELQDFGDPSELDYPNYLLLRTTTSVTKQKIEDANEFNDELFWLSSVSDGGNQTKNIERRIEADTVSWEEMKAANYEYPKCEPTSIDNCTPNIRNEISGI